MDNKSAQKSINQVGIRITQDMIIPSALKPRHFESNTSYPTGTIYYVDSNGNFTSLDIGSTGQVLQVISGIPTWVEYPQTGTSRPTSGRFIGDSYFDTSSFVLSYWIGSAWKSTTLA